VIDATTGQPIDAWLGQNYPVWSADGSSAAYVVTENEQAQLVVAKQDGSDVRILNRGKKDVGVGGLTWSPNGRTIAFHHGGSSVNWSQIMAVDTATGRVRPLTVARGHADTFPAFSQDGKRIAFARMTFGRQPRVPRVAVVLARGGAVHVYRGARTNWAAPLWRPRAH
jgi:tricorn protease-like protein